MKKNQNGVTLIALAVTIIVMLILAGATMSMLTGNSGILTNAKKSTAANEESDAYEKMGQAFNAVLLDVEAESALDGSFDATENLDDYVTMVKNEIGAAQVVTEDEAKTIADLQADQSTYAKKFVVYADDTNNKIHIIYFSKTFYIQGDGKSTQATSKNQYPALEASINFDTNSVTYTKPVTSAVDANQVK